MLIMRSCFASSRPLAKKYFAFSRYFNTSSTCSPDFVGVRVILVRSVIYLPGHLHGQDSEQLFPTSHRDFKVFRGSGTSGKCLSFGLKSVINQSNFKKSYSN